MVTLSEYLMGREKQFPLSEEQINNAVILVEKLNDLETELCYPLHITSGYRPSQINQGVQGSKPHDAHEKCCGVDLRDPHMGLSDLLLRQLDILERLGLWMESPQSAKDHVHLQTYPPKSGRRVFIA